MRSGFLLTQVNLKNEFRLSPSRSVADVYGSPGQFIGVFLPQIFLIAGLIVFFLLVAGGFRIIGGAGDPKSIEAGKKTITGALIGFTVIFTAYWIIQLVETVTGVRIFNSGL